MLKRKLSSLSHMMFDVFTFPLSELKLGFSCPLPLSVHTVTLQLLKMAEAPPRPCRFFCHRCSAEVTPRLPVRTSQAQQSVGKRRKCVLSKYECVRSTDVHALLLLGYTCLANLSVNVSNEVGRQRLQLSLCIYIHTLSKWEHLGQNQGQLSQINTVNCLVAFSDHKLTNRKFHLFLMS